MLLPAILFFLFATPQLMAALNDANAMKIPNRIPLIVLGAYFFMVPFTWVDCLFFCRPRVIRNRLCYVCLWLDGRRRLKATCCDSFLVHLA